MPPLLIPAAAAIGFIGNAYGTLYCGIALAVSLGGIAALLSSNVLTMLCIAGFVLLSSATLGIGLRKRLPYRLLAVLVAFFALAALYLDTALPSLLAGKEPFAGMVELFYQLEDAYKQAGLDISSLQLSTEFLPEVFYGVLIALAEGVGFLGSNDIAAARPFLLVTCAGDRPFLCAGVVCGILLPYLSPRSLQFACSTQVVVPPEQLTVSLRV